MINEDESPPIHISEFEISLKNGLLQDKNDKVPPAFLLNKLTDKHNKQKRKYYLKEGFSRSSPLTISKYYLGKITHILYAKVFGGFRSDLKISVSSHDDESEKMEKSRSVRVSARKLLQQATTTQNPQNSEESGGLSVAWIAAIVINAVLILLFIFVVVYCYCKNRKQRRLSRTGSIERNYRGNPDIMYVEKATNHMKGSEKAALIGSDSVYTVEGDRGKHNRHPDDHFELSKDRCTCNSPQCYCSVGDDEIGTTSPRRLEQNFEEDEEEEVSEPHIPTPEPEPKFQTPEPFYEPEEQEDEDEWRPESEPEEREEEEEEEEQEEEEESYVPGTVTPEPVIPLEKRYLMYRVTDDEGSRDNIGQLVITGDVPLNQLRRHIQRDNRLASFIDRKKYHFLDEDMKPISSFQESSLDLDRIFPSQAINIQFEKKPKIPKKPRAPAYVGPLGICSAEDCTNPARLKCLDCGNTAYCSTKCMRIDKLDHQKACYKPPWRV